MKTTTLYVIGNGFDLHHGIPSAYKDFGAFVKRNDPEIYGLIEEYFGIDDGFWSDFEAQLAHFDADTLIEHASAFLIPYSAEDWSDAYHHDYQYEIDRVVKTLSRGLKRHFASWIRQLRMPDSAAIPSRMLRLDAGATFLNFNYTPSLMTLYGIPKSQVHHIHGATSDADTDVILGHGWNPKERGSSNDGLDLEATDTRVSTGNRIIDQYFEETFKPTERVIAAHQSFFEGLRDTRRILVMGHSLADVDLPYFKEIVQRIDGGNVSWKISYYDGDNLLRLRRQFDKLAGAFGASVEFAQLADF